MTKEEIIQAVHDRITNNGPRFNKIFPKANIEFDVGVDFGNTIMDIFVKRGIVPIENVRDYVLKNIKTIDHDLIQELVPDRFNKELRASIELGIKVLGNEFPDILMPALLARWEQTDIRHEVFAKSRKI